MKSIATPQRLGDILVSQAAVTRERLEQQLLHARGQMGEYLRAIGVITGRDLSRAVAFQQGLTSIHLQETPPDATLFTPRDFAHYTRLRYIPFARSAAELVIATPAPTPALAQWAAHHYGTPVRMVVIPPRDFAAYFISTGATASSRQAQLSLRRRYPHLVADQILHLHQRRGLAILIGLLLLACVLAPTTSLMALLVACNLFYLSTLAVKYALYVTGVAVQPAIRQRIETLTAAARMDDSALPVYTLLIPLYRESPAVIARLIEQLNALDYPKEKLDIKLICEADDDATVEALCNSRPPETMEIIRVPPSLPRTKPKACNVALPHIRGEYLVIFDAEDAPATNQLKHAVAMFVQSEPSVACLQAPLNYYNRDENLLTQLFSIEYSALFRILIPALEKLKLPIPLGGTSNHLRVSALREAGGWDAFNVTEDADLGIRLAYLGFETRMLPSLTLEESPITLWAWLRQRTRWIKGYIQTWLVYTRDTAALKQRLGTMGYYGFQFFVGAPALTFLIAPIFWLIFLGSWTGMFPRLLPIWMQIACLISMAAGIVSHWLFARAVLRIEGWQRMRLAMLAYPFYWMLHSIAAARALWQLITAPHYWEKTCHGVSQINRRK